MSYENDMNMGHLCVLLNIAGVLSSEGLLESTRPVSVRSLQHETFSQ